MAIRPHKTPTTPAVIFTLWPSGDAFLPTGNEAAKRYSVFVRRLGSVGVVGATKTVADSFDAQGVIPIAELNKVKLPRLHFGSATI